MRWRKAPAVLTATLALGGAYWAGCGGDDDDGAFFTGDVSSVVGGSSAALERSRPSLFDRLGPALAFAQSSCSAPSGDLLFCVDEVCTRVDEGDCRFARLVPVEGGGPTFVTLRFVDDTDEDGNHDADEGDSIVDDNLAICDGDQILVAGAAINFDGTTTASISKTVDNCSGTSPTRTVGTGTPSPTRTPTTGGSVPTATPTTSGGATATPTTSGGATATPTYGVAMNDTPLPSFAFFASIAVIGLLLPRRRRRNGEDA